MRNLAEKAVEEQRKAEYTKRRVKQRKPYYLITLGVFILLIFGWVVVTDIMSWASAREFHKQSVVDLHFHLPIKISKKEAPKAEVVVEKPKFVDYEGQVDTPTKQYIVDKFGVADAKVALAVAQAESNFNESAIHYNTDSSYDIGIFQVNSVHWKQPGCSLQELVFANKNIDCAYEIWLASGHKFTAWSTFQNGSWLAYAK